MCIYTYICMHTKLIYIIIWMTHINAHCMPTIHNKLCISTMGTCPNNDSVQCRTHLCYQQFTPLLQHPYLGITTGNLDLSRRLNGIASNAQWIHVCIACTDQCLAIPYRTGTFSSSIWHGHATLFCTLSIIAHMKEVTKKSILIWLHLKRQWSQRFRVLERMGKLRQGWNLLNKVENASLWTKEGCGLYTKVKPIA